MTRLPSSPEVQAKRDPKTPGVLLEYSAREVAPSDLILHQLLRAHQIFLLHQASSLADLWVKTARHTFCGFLQRFWDEFIFSWDVLLHGNPAVDVYNGIKLSAGGELGIGEGEEEWGSGEREILEGFVERTEGLVDLVVSRFGGLSCQEPAQTNNDQVNTSNQRVNNISRYCLGEYPRPEDGVIFSGVGALTRSSIRSVTGWLDWLYIRGEDAYGVRDNPSSAIRSTRKKLAQPADTVTTIPGSDHPPKCIPPPIIRTSNTVTSKQRKPSSGNVGHALGRTNQTSPISEDPTTAGTESLMKYLTLGVYGSSWGIPAGRPINTHVSDSHSDNRSRSTDSKEYLTCQNSYPGYYLVGLLGNLDDDPGEQNVDNSKKNGRIVMRTLHVERKRLKGLESCKTVDEVYFDRLRVIVYVQRPFIFTFLFELQAQSLMMPSFYRSLHHQLGPLRRPLISSTSPDRVSQRLWEAASPRNANPSQSTQPISDLVWDPARLTVHTTIPNIPEPGHDIASSPWTRTEAMTVHSQILNTLTATRRHSVELERTCKTSRGWWVVWLRLPYTATSQDKTDSRSYREAFLIRKATDYNAPVNRTVSRAASNESVGWGPAKLAEGIGVDARKYIEGLLSLNR